MFVRSIALPNKKVAIKINTSTLAMIQLIFLMNIQWIIDIFNLPGVLIRFEVVIPLLVSIINIRKILVFLKKEKMILAFIGIYFVNMIIGWIFNGLNPIYVAWNFFSNYIFFFFFLSCCVSLKGEDINKGLEIMSMFHVLNVLLCAYQYLVLGLYSDYLGGLFGTRQGCNGAQNIFAIVVCCYQMYKFMQGGRLFKLLFYLGTFVVIAALADLMGFFVEISICIVIMMLSIHGISKKMKMIVIIVCGAFVGVDVFRWLYPGRFEYFLSLQNWAKYIGLGNNNSGGIYGISRTNPFSQINSLFFDNELTKQLFGIGYGNAVYSDSIKMFQSPFYIYNKKFAYNWFATAYTYIEAGLVGVFSYVLLLCGFIKNSLILKKKGMYRNKGIFGFMLAFSFLFLFFYNQSLIVTPAYMMYFALSSIFVYKRMAVSNRYI